MLSRDLNNDFFQFQTNNNVRYTRDVKIGFLNPIYPNVKEWLYFYLKNPHKAVYSKWSSVKKNYNFTFVNVTRMYLYIYVQEYYWPLWFKTSCALENIVSFCRSIWLYNTPLRCLNGNVCGTFFSSLKYGNKIKLLGGSLFAMVTNKHITNILYPSFRYFA